MVPGSLRTVKRPVPKAQLDAYGPAIPQLAARGAHVDQERSSVEHEALWPNG